MEGSKIVNGGVELSNRNKKVYDDVIKQLELNGRCAVVQPTGTGKSYIMMGVLWEYKDKMKVVIGSSIKALDRLKENKCWVKERVMVSTYANLHNLIKDIKSGGINVSLIVLDEMHRAGAVVWGKQVKELLNICNGANVLGLTATPIRYLDKKRDMVTEMFNGISVGNMTLKMAIEDGILPSPIYVTGMFDISKDIDERLRLLVSRGLSSNKAVEELRVYKEVWDRDKYIIDIMSRHLELDGNNSKHIVFAPTIDVANNMLGIVTNWFKSVYKGYNVRVYIIHSRNRNNDKEFSLFCDNKECKSVDVLISVNMANESIHIENTKSVMMLRYTQSPNLYVQQIGRALASGGKEPVIFDFIGNLEAIGNVVEFLGIMEGKVNNMVRDRLYDEVGSRGIFKEYEDNTGEFRGVIGVADRVVCNKWEDNIYKIQEQGGVDGIRDNKLKIWYREQQRRYMIGSLTVEQEIIFRGLGDIIYRVESLDGYMLKLLDSIKENGLEDIEVQYRLYCNKLPIEILRYIRDKGLRWEFNDTWFRGICNKYNSKTTDKFLKLVNDIKNDSSINLLSDVALDVEKYLSVIGSIIKLNSLYDKYLDKDNTVDGIYTNLLYRYWKLNLSEISSNIEIDVGTLENHILVCKRYLGLSLTVEEELEYKGNISNIPENLRARTTNLLIGKINKIGIQ